MLKDTLLYLSQNERVHDFVINNQLARGASRRFVAGEDIESAIVATRTLNVQGIHAALDYLGENVSSEEEARSATSMYCSAIELIKRAGVNANVSVKLPGAHQQQSDGHFGSAESRSAPNTETQIVLRVANGRF